MFGTRYSISGRPQYRMSTQGKAAASLTTGRGITVDTNVVHQYQRQSQVELQYVRNEFTCGKVV